MTVLFEGTRSSWYAIIRVRFIQPRVCRADFRFLMITNPTAGSSLDNATRLVACLSKIRRVTGTALA